MSLRDQALVSVYKSVKDRLPDSIGAVDFIKSMDDWDVVPLTENGQVIGGVITKGAELHVGYYPKPTRSIRRHIRETLGAILEQYGFAETTVMRDNVAGLRFCERLGFYPVHEGIEKVTLRCEKGELL
jgi:hypothetical protein